VFQQHEEIIEVGKFDDLRMRHTNAEVNPQTKRVMMAGVISAHLHVAISLFQLSAAGYPSSYG